MPPAREEADKTAEAHERADRLSQWQAEDAGEDQEAVDTADVDDVESVDA